MHEGTLEDEFEYDTSKLAGGMWRGAKGNECSYDQDGNPSPDPAQTWNFYPDSRTIGHVWNDWAAHYWYGGDCGYTPNLTTWY